MNCRDLITQLQIQLGDSHGDYHSTANLLAQVNQALRDISGRARCVDVKGFLPAIADQYQYGLPLGFLTMHRVAYAENDGDWYPLIPSTIPDIESIVGWLSSNVPWNYDIWGAAAIEKAVNTVASTAVENQFRVAQAYGGIKAGDKLINLSDAQSDSTITEVTVNIEEDWTDITYTDLRGGTRTEFEVDDAFRILSPEVSQKTLMIAPPPAQTDEAGQESIWIYYSRLHREFTQLDMDRENDELELDLELQTALMHRCLYWARGGELGFADNETQAQAVLYESNYHIALPHVRRRIKQNIAAWRQNARIRSRGVVDIVETTSSHVFSRGIY